MILFKDIMDLTMEEINIGFEKIWLYATYDAGRYKWYSCKSNCRS